MTEELLRLYHPAASVTIGTAAPVRPSRIRGRFFGLLALLCLAAVAVAGGVYAQHQLTPSASRPNVLMVVADDMRADGLMAMPSLTHLAEERGITFDRFYVATPLCCPSRATIMTGLYARHHGVLTNQLPLGSVARFDDHSTLATWAQAAGARTALVGRYLNGYESLAIPPGWSTWFGIFQSGEGYSNYYRYRVNDNGTQRYYASTPKDYSTRVIAQQALQFLGAEQSQPFLLMLTPRTPHGPATPDPQDSGAYKGVDLPLSPSFDEEDVSDKPGYVKDRSRLSPKDREELEQLRRLQLESLLGLDRAIESLVQALRADGRLDNTWVIFTSDNGLTLGEHRLGEGKMCPYEECVRVPLIVIPPGAAAPRHDDHLVSNIDLAPTVAEILGAQPTAPVDGRSFLPLLRDLNAPWRDALVLEQWFENPEPLFVGIRTADRKYVRYQGRDEELYDLQADPYELESLHERPAWADEKRRLNDRLNALLAEPSAPPRNGGR